MTFRPGMKVGILGGGQLGRMLALDGLPLGLEFRFLEPASDPPAGHLGDVVVGAYDDPGAVDRFSPGLDVVTYEFENVPVESAHRLEASLPVHPAPAALDMAQDRLAEKEGFRSLGIGTAPFVPVSSLEDLRKAADELGFPSVLKTRRLGYDGKGQAVLRSPADLEPAWERIGGVPLILEGFVAFDRELSIIGARGLDGSIEDYPLVQNHHEDGILRVSVAPAPDLNPELQDQADSIMRAVFEALGYVGVLAIELFQVGDRLLANEMAPRVHNSGHWTQDGAETSQFENHLRAVTGMPLGSARARGHSTMVNLLGSLPDLDRVLTLPGVHLHLYGKSPRPGRKLGHVNVVGEDPVAVAETVRQLKELLPPAF
jgi:5-(carboxyamino)imidazole ribonucleotide synthase